MRKIGPLSRTRLRERIFLKWILINLHIAQNLENLKNSSKHAGF